MDEKQLQMLWDLHAKNGGFASFDEFKQLMNDSSARKVYFDNANTTLGFKDYSDFENTLGVAKKKGLFESIGQGVSPFLQTGGQVGNGKAPLKEENISAVEDPAKYLLQPYRERKVQAEKEYQKNLPIGGYNLMAIPKADTKQEYDVATKDLSNMEEQVFNKLFPDTRHAISYIQQKYDQAGGKVPEDNETFKIALQKVNQRRGLDDIVASSSSIEDAAAKYYGENFNDLPDIKKGKYLRSFLNRPEVKEKADEGGQFLHDYNVAKGTLISKYPQDALQKIATDISQELEDKKMTNWFYSNPSVDKTDKAVQQLVDEGKMSLEEKNVYDKALRPIIEAGGADVVLKTSDLIHGLGRGLYHGMENIDATLRDVVNRVTFGTAQKTGLIETNEERRKRLENERLSQTELQPKGARKFVTEASEFAGFSIPMIFGSMAKVPQAMNMALMFEGANADKARDLFKDDAGKQDLYTLLSTGADMYIMKLLPTKKFAEGAKNLFASDIKGLINELGSGKISQEQASKTFLEKLTNYAKKVGVTNFETANALTAFQLAHNTIDAAFGKRDFNLENEVKEALTNYKTNFLSGTFLSMVGAAPKSNEINTNGKILRELANRSEQVLPEIKNDAEKIKNLQTAIQINKEIESKDWNEDYKNKFMANAMKESVLKEKQKSAPTEALKKQSEEELDRAKKTQEAILAGKNPDEVKTDNEIELERLQKDKELSDKDFEAKRKQLDGRTPEDRPKIEKLEEDKKRAEEDYQREVEKLSPKVKPEETFPEGENIPTQEVTQKPIEQQPQAISSGEQVGEKKNVSVIMPNENKVADVVPLKETKEKQIEKLNEDRKGELADIDEIHNNFLKENPDTDIEKLNALKEKQIKETNDKYDKKISKVQQSPEIKQPIKGEADKNIQPTEEGEKTPPPPNKTEPIVEEGGEDKVSGITHADTAEVRERLGLPPYQRAEPTTHDKLIQDAKQAIADNPNIANEVMDKYKNGGKMTPEDNAILSEYKAALDYQLENNPSKEIFDKINEVINVLEPAGSEAGKLLESRKLLSAKEDNLSNFLLDKQMAQGTALTDSQIKTESEKYNELKKAKEDLEKQLQVEREQHAKDIAELGFNKAKAKARKEAKKTDEEYKAERKKSVEDARKALKDIREKGLQSTIPGIQELKAIAPHVKDYLNSLASQGIDKLDNAVNQIYAEFKDVLDGIKKTDILDIIGGQYDKEKELTRNEKAATIRLLQREARLLKELSDARKGIEKTKSESKKVQTNRRIDELKEKIKEVRRLNKERDIDEAPKDETVGGEENNARLEKQLLQKVEKLKSDLKNKVYLEEKPQPKPLSKSRKTILLQDKVMDLENRIRHERMKDEYNKRSKWRKIYDKVMQFLGIRRIVQSAVDISIPFRQGATLISPTRIGTWVKAFQANIKSVFSPKKFDRIMYEIRHDEDYHNMLNDNVVLNEMRAADPELHNEDFKQSFIYDIPIISEPLKASNRSADAFLNVARWDMYKRGKMRLEKQGLTRESDPEAYKRLGNWIMNMTGRGKMAKMIENGQAHVVLGNTFYGARLMASRFNLLNPLTYFDPRIPKEVRHESLKDILAFTATVMGTGTALALTTGAKISLNPDDSDFLQLRYGNKVYDISGGLANYVRTGLRLTKAMYIKATGTTYQGRKSTENAAQSVLQFFRNKLAPNTAYATDAMFGKSYGQKFDPAEFFQIYPMYTQDVIKAYKEEGVLSLATVLAPNMVGIGFGSYASKGQIDATLEDLKKRNMRSDEMNNEKIFNYNEGGRPITDKEFDKYADNRDAEIEKGLTKLFNEGALVLDEKYNVVQKPYKELTAEQVKKEVAEIKTKATEKIKKEMFGEQIKSIRQQVGESLLESQKEIKELQKQNK